MTVGTFCSSCGAVVRPAALYCSACGAAAGPAGSAPPVPPPATVGTVGAVIGGRPPGPATSGGSDGSGGVIPGGRATGDGPSFGYPSFGRRVLVFVIDTVPVLVIAALLWLFWPMEGPSTLWWVLVAAATALVVGTAAVLAALGRSPGSAAWDLRVVRERTSAPPGLVGVGRLLLKYLLLVGTLTVAGFSPLWDSQRRGRAWWDRAVGTAVVPRGRPVRPVAAPSDAGVLPWDIPPVSAVAVPGGPQVAAAGWADRPADTPGQQRSTAGIPTPVAAVPVPLWTAESPTPWGSSDVPVAVGPVTELITSVPGRPGLRNLDSGPPVGPDSSSGAGRSPGPDAAVPQPDDEPAREDDREPDATPLDHTRMAPSRPTAPPTWQLTFDGGRALPLDGALIVGRNPAVAPDDNGAAVLALVDEDRSVSKTHLRLDARANGVVVTDRHSTNGVTVVSGSTTIRCVPGVPTAVPDGSTVRFGDREFVIRRV